MEDLAIFMMVIATALEIVFSLLAVTIIAVIFTIFSRQNQVINYSIKSAFIWALIGLINKIIWIVASQMSLGAALTDKTASTILPITTLMGGIIGIFYGIGRGKQRE
ncbi:MAG TPA: hypothetical protein IGS52_25740 [Oscillatoriaceae cyanobacterium M33_DOE_052]|uniref:Uncharacterized protein n=1 Tax=Planktothricoides sp. SpSt-374 TaxID=2282167 RepID=A0A7C3VJU3_9CYAN|nr:hypothetical protein [Oscillatoriaceae cyanobacterium M33_DOE_052]